MTRFYFNECLPESFSGSVQDIFYTSIKTYNHIIKDSALNILEGIITHKIPSEISICGTSLKNIIDSCGDKDLRRVAYRYFTMYPIDVLYDLEDIFDNDTIGVKHIFNEHDATNLIVAHQMGWIILSLPLSAVLKCDTLSIVSENKNTIVNNWYGENTHHLVKCISDRIEIRNKKVLELKYSFVGKKCIMSDSFIKSYLYSPTNLQNLIIEKFKDAQQATLLFPAKHDDNLTKVCKGAGNEETYELRFHSFGGVRIYFECDTECIYLGVMETKSSSEGKEQSNDIYRATNEIRKLKNK